MCKRPVAEANHISLEQAQAIVIGNNFHEWSADLQDNMEPPVAK
jgi:hypothetical protein